MGVSEREQRETEEGHRCWDEEWSWRGWDEEWRSGGGWGALRMD